ncbi:MAG: adenylate/guanylate cyclase domain-containing protein [Spirochaetia bacterium]|nr:adenylate/guanylate cyclase domain-containing protein [Spirochaetia bacterium]
MGNSSKKSTGRLKQISTIVFFISLTVFLINYISLRVVKDDLKNLIELVNWQMSGQISEKINNEIEKRYKLYKEVEILKETLAADKISEHLKKMLLDSKIETMHFSFYKSKDNFPLKAEYSFNHPELLKNVNSQELAEYLNGIKNLVEKGFEGKAGVKNISKEFNQPILALVLPSKDGFRVKNIFIAFVKADSIAQALLTEKMPENTIVQKDFVSFVTDASGDIILHPEVKKILSVGDYKENPAVKKMILDKKDSNLIRFTEGETEYWGAFKRLDNIELGVVTIVPSSKASSSISVLHMQSSIAVFIVILLVVLVIYFFGGKSAPELNETLEIKAEDISEKIPEESVEISKEKELPSENTLIENMLITEKKNAIVCLTAIQLFSKSTEGLSAEESVRLLSDFYLLLKEIVFEKKGLVNKYVGNAVLSSWNLDSADQNGVKECVEAALLTRDAFEEYNKKTGKNIKIACGISIGDVLSGSVKIEDGYENSLTGLPVKIAAKIEKAALSFGADILICSETYEVVKDEIQCKEIGKIKLKNDQKERKLYSVIGKNVAEKSDEFAELNQETQEPLLTETP